MKYLSWVCVLEQGLLTIQSTGHKFIKLFSCSAQLRLKFIVLINVKMPTIVGILTFISMLNYRLWNFNIFGLFWYL